jgi:outer membrane protein assembly factor BamB
MLAPDGGGRGGVIHLGKAGSPFPYRWLVSRVFLMRILIGAVVSLALFGSTAAAQRVVLGRQYSNPTVPAKRALDRLNLTTAWRTYLPVGGRRDGIFSVQILDHQILVQTVAGTILAVDADTGKVLWKTRVGQAYRTNHALAYNKKSVYAVRSDFLVALNRATGRTEWKFKLPDGPSAAPVADDERVYLSLGARIYTYTLPDVKLWERLRREKQKQSEGKPSTTPSLDLYGGSSGITLENLASKYREESPEPLLSWSYLLETGRLQGIPLLGKETLGIATSRGFFLATSTYNHTELYRFQTEAEIIPPLGQYGDIAYLPSEDFNLYAFRISTGKVVWRFTSGAENRQKPEVTDKDVFIVGHQRGLFRLDRKTGKEIWRNREADRFGSVNGKFVYAFDRSGRLLVLDYKRGTKLGTLDTRDFVFPISNELTDRLYLAAHNGLLVCLRDHNLTVPLVNKKVPDEFVPGPKKNGKDKNKGNGEKKDKDNGEKKDKDKEEKMDK